jgi:cell division protein FtsI/penicillin-binding protein 2
MKRFRLSLLALPIVALVAAGIAVPRADDAAPTRDGAEETEGSPSAAMPSAAAATAELLGIPPPALGDPRLDPALGRYVAPLGEGRAILTLVPALQARLERALQGYRVPWGATVLLEPATGRVLALAEHSRAEPGRKGLALAALAPAASIFKIVTAAALLERGVGADGAVCYHGGKRRLDPRLLRDDPRRDRRCMSLSAAFGHSANVVFAKLADRDLDPETLRAAAGRFLFNVRIPFARPVEISTAEVPADPFAAANTAAGFGPVRLSALHAALLAAIVANGGTYVPPVLVEEAQGTALPHVPPASRVVDEEVAAELGEMMRETVETGTARRVFRRVARSMRGVGVAGKTGSLADPSPYRDYSWFVGYAPADKPEVAVATVVVNERLWHARAPTVAKEALEAYFAGRASGEGGAAVRTAAVR